MNKRRKELTLLEHILRYWPFSDGFGGIIKPKNRALKIYRWNNSTEHVQLDHHSFGEEDAV